MKLLTVESITQDALKILDRSFHDTYTKHHRQLHGGNNAIHGLIPLHQTFGGIDAAHEGIDNEEGDTRHALR